MDALAGNTPAGADPLTIREAKAVRQAMLERREREAAPEFDAESGLQRLLFRLRKERLDGARGAHRYVALALAATIVLAVGLLLFLPKPGDEERPVFRGAEGPQILFADDPVKARDELKHDLEALGLAPRITPQEDATLVEAPWPERVEERHRALLERHYLRPPESRTLSVEVRKRP